MRPKKWLESILRGKGEPVISFLDSPLQGEPDEYLSAANLWNLIYEKASFLSANHVPQKSVLVSDLVNKSQLIDFLACMMLEGTFYLHHDTLAPDESITDGDGFCVSPSGSILPYDLKTTGLGSISDRRGGVFIRTSGTEGRKGKPVFLSWEKVIQQVEDHSAYLNTTVGQSRLSILPKYHCFGLILDFLVGLHLRQTIYLAFSGQQRSQHLLSWIIEHQIEITALIPRQLFYLSQQLQINEQKSLKLRIHVGGAPLEEQVKNNLSRFGIVLTEGYGLTEAGPGVLMDGTPIGCEVKLSRIEGAETSIGELWVKSPTLGEFENRVLDESGFYATGDLARFVDGRYEIIGRIDEKIKKTDGTWESIRQIEQEVAKKFSAKQALFLSPILNHSRLLLLADTSRLNVDEVQYFLRRQLGRSFDLIVVDPKPPVLREIELTAGKDQRSALDRWARVVS